MKLLSLALFAALSATSFAKTYPITGDSVNCRSGPGTSYAIKTSYKKGQSVSISCQTSGTSYAIKNSYKKGQSVSISCQASGTSVSGNNIWDKTSDGCYVSDYYVKTGVNGYVTTKCGSSGGGGSSDSYCKKINSAGVNLIAQWEGFVASPKPDPIGLPTVGYGHLCQQKNCAEVKYKFPLSQTTAKQLLSDDLPKYTTCLASYLNSKVKLNDNQLAALTSWSFNVGCGNVKTSTLVKRLNTGESPNTVADQELPKWRMAGGQVMQGLVNRRKAEIKLFKTASSKEAYPKCQ